MTTAALPLLQRMALEGVEIVLQSLAGVAEVPAISRILLHVVDLIRPA
jgi:hypothetical protein